MYNSNIKFTMEEIKTKVCRKCGRELPLSEFHKKYSSKDGLQSFCKECSNKAASSMPRGQEKRRKLRRLRTRG